MFACLYVCLKIILINNNKHESFFFTSETTCGYYVSRDASRFAEVVVLPYAMLLHAPTRRALNINLRGAIVVLDECHNVPAAIASAHEAELVWR